MARPSQTVTITKPGKPITDEAGNLVLDDNGEQKLGPPVTTKTILVESLSAKEAMDADDFALANSPTGNPTRDNRLRALAVCAVRQIDKESVLKPYDLDSYQKLLNRFDVSEVQQLAAAYLVFANGLDDQDDPKDLPPDKASSG